MMLTSLELMQASGISRATLNNYIALGLLPRPLVKTPGTDAATRARQIGYFPQEVLARIEQIRQLKKSGLPMSEIVRQMQVEGSSPDVRSADSGDSSDDDHVAAGAHEQLKNAAVPPVDAMTSSQLRVTIDQVPFPAYMVNYNFEITWYNQDACNELLGIADRLPGDIKERNALVYLLKGKYGQNPANREALVQFHLMLGKGRLTRNDLMGVLSAQANSFASTGNRPVAESYPSGSLAQLPLVLCSSSGEHVEYCVHASYYREGILFVYAPGSTGCDSLLGLLQRRDEVIRNLLKKRLPVLTDVAVLVSDLQNSVRICTELPPDEYFELINQIWATMEPIFRKYYGTHGKHVGDGMVYYFFPQPDCNYILNALICAQEIKAAMRKISKEWQLRKNWTNELYLNTGINEGQEWLGVFHVDTKVEFTVLGDTINHTARLSDFSRSGAIWATKNLLGKLSTEQRQRVKFGIRRRNEDGFEVLVNSSYSRIMELVDIGAPSNDKLRDVSALPVTEIFGVEASDQKE
jgi:class 3 adenylate cyclase/DNA-binding transcriptional MerR regulator